MPNYDSGTYFLTTLIPVRTDTIRDGASGASPVHALRRRIAELPTALQTPFCSKQSPFARNTRVHFARLVVIDDVAYVGRKPDNALLTVLTELILPPKWHINPVVAKPQDHLSCPFLLFTADFDAASGDDGERASWLRELWDSAGEELRNIFQYCHDFENQVRDSASFATYVARCQIETTMPFHDYYMDGAPLAQLPELAMSKLALVFAAVALPVFLLLEYLLFSGSASCLLLALAILGGALAGGFAVWFMVMKLGAKPYPPPQDATLPSVLKALHLKNQFTRFAIDNQSLSVDADPAAQQQLYERFAAFAAANKPDDLEQPTQEPGVVGI